MLGFPLQLSVHPVAVARDIFDNTSCRLSLGEIQDQEPQEVLRTT